VCGAGAGRISGSAAQQQQQQQQARPRRRVQAGIHNSAPDCFGSRPPRLPYGNSFAADVSPSKMATRRHDGRRVVIVGASSSALVQVFVVVLLRSSLASAAVPSLDQ